MNWKKGDKIYCINEANYQEVITKGKQYIIHAIGKETKQGKLRIKNNRNRLVWISDDYFVDYEIPSILFIQIDDEIKNPKKAYVEVTIIFSDGNKRWMIFTTPQHLDFLFNDNRDYIIGYPFIILKEVNEFIIKKSVRHLYQQNELIKNSQAYT